MASFKVGDRVKYAGGRSLGVIREGQTGTVVGIDRNGKYQVWLDEPREDGFSLRTPEGREYHWLLDAGGLRALSIPRKDTPAMGDTVRVVLEGKVEAATDDGWFRVGIVGGNLIQPARGHVKSVEILEPAKPSVKDLPVGSVVRDVHNDILVKAARNTWKMAGNGLEFSDTEMDAEGWTLLVPQESA